MLQQEAPGDYVVATGETHSVREFCERAFARAGISLRWTGTGADEKGRRRGERKAPRGRRSALLPSGGGRRSPRGRLEGPRRARLVAADRLRRARRDDGGRRPREGAEGSGRSPGVSRRARFRFPAWPGGREAGSRASSGPRARGPGRGPRPGADRQRRGDPALVEREPASARGASLPVSRRPEARPAARCARSCAVVGAARLDRDASVPRLPAAPGRSFRRRPRGATRTRSRTNSSRLVAARVMTARVASGIDGVRHVREILPAPILPASLIASRRRGRARRAPDCRDGSGATGRSASTSSRRRRSTTPTGATTNGRGGSAGAGDFVTASSWHPAFGRTIARIARRLREEEEKSSAKGEEGAPRGLREPTDLVDVGAGEGEMLAAADEALRSWGIRDEFRLVGVERSAARRARAAERVPSASWLSSFEEIPGPFSGLLVAYELFDALPVRALFFEGERLLERFVGAGGASRSQRPEISSNGKKAIVPDSVALLETCARAGSFSARASGSRSARQRIPSLFPFQRRSPGVSFSSSTTGPRPVRSTVRPVSPGTLEAFRAHQVTRDVLSDPGSRDITAWVDFTEIADGALARPGSPWRGPSARPASSPRRGSRRRSRRPRRGRRRRSVSSSVTPSASSWRRAEWGSRFASSSRRAAPISGRALVEWPNRE